jgi:predicted ATPase
MKVAVETGDDDVLFVAINQINSGSAAAITNPEEYFIMARHNMNAGKRAMALSNFHTAFTLFDNGISFLRKDHWKKHYAFSLELYELAARCALASGSLLQVPMLTDHILRNAHCFEDQLNAQFILMLLQERNPSTLPDALEKVSGLSADYFCAIDFPSTYSY